VLVGADTSWKDERIGRYVVLRRIAVGGMAELFLAKQLGLDGFERAVAIKRILAHLANDEDFLHMFRNEARIVAKLSHPNIVQIFDLGKSDDTYFIAMEYIAGRNLAAVAKKAREYGEKIPPAFLAHWGAQVASGLHYAHTRTGADGRPLSIVHRDVSPQNIILSFAGGVKLVDFGIAKAASQLAKHKTRVGVLKGKYAYMSPEQIRGQEIDGRSDIFAMGILLYEVLCGVRPFSHESSMQTIRAIVEDRHADPRQYNSEIPNSLVNIINRALSKEPRDRYDNAQTMQIELEEVVRTQPTRTNTVETVRWLTSLFADELSDESTHITVEGVGSVIMPAVSGGELSDVAGTSSNGVVIDAFQSARESLEASAFAERPTDSASALSPGSSSDPWEEPTEYPSQHDGPSSGSALEASLPEVELEGEWVEPTRFDTQRDRLATEDGDEAFVVERMTAEIPPPGDETIVMPSLRDLNEEWVSGEQPEFEGLDFTGPRSTEPHSELEERVTAPESSQQSSDLLDDATIAATQSLVREAEGSVPNAVAFAVSGGSQEPFSLLSLEMDEEFDEDDHELFSETMLGASTVALLDDEDEPEAPLPAPDPIRLESTLAGPLDSNEAEASSSLLEDASFEATSKPMIDRAALLLEGPEGWGERLPSTSKNAGPNVLSQNDDLGLDLEFDEWGSGSKDPKSSSGAAVDKASSSGDFENDLFDESLLTGGTPGTDAHDVRPDYVVPGPLDPPESGRVTGSIVLPSGRTFEVRRQIREVIRTGPVPGAAGMRLPIAAISVEPKASHADFLTEAPPAAIRPVRPQAGLSRRGIIIALSLFVAAFGLTIVALLGTPSGRLEIETDPPGATVYLNEAIQPGVTPLMLSRLRPGTAYRVDVKRPGYHSETRSVSLPKGRTSSKIVVQLRRTATD
jgi:serine/threonine protein kinase